MTIQQKRRKNHEGSGSSTSKGKDGLVHDLRVALMTQQLHLAFQPKVSAHTYQTVGAEVLLRWQHPIEGLIPADRWVMLAETHNLMRPLTLWLVDKTIDYIKNAGEAALPLAINVPPSVLNGAFALHVLERITAAGIPPHLLEIEITEAVPIVNKTNLANAARLLQSKGLKIYLDDFGTGYSTMQHLVDVPVDGVKMDKSFVQQAALVPAARLILRSLIELAHEIGLTVICEGVETLEQLDLVKRLGAEIIQGYLTGKPMSEEAFTAILGAPLLPVLPLDGLEHYKAHAS